MADRRERRRARAAEAKKARRRARAEAAKGKQKTKAKKARRSSPDIAPPTSVPRAPNVPPSPVEDDDAVAPLAVAEPEKPRPPLLTGWKLSPWPLVVLVAAARPSARSCFSDADERQSRGISLRTRRRCARGTLPSSGDLRCAVGIM